MVIAHSSRKLSETSGRIIGPLHFHLHCISKTHTVPERSGSHGSCASAVASEALSAAACAHESAIERDAGAAERDACADGSDAETGTDARDNDEENEDDDDDDKDDE